MISVCRFLTETFATEVQTASQIPNNIPPEERIRRLQDIAKGPAGQSHGMSWQEMQKVRKRMERLTNPFGKK